MKTTVALMLACILFLSCLPALAEDSLPFQLSFSFDAYDANDIAYINAALANLPLSNITVDRENTHCHLRAIIERDMKTGEELSTQYHYMIDSIALDCTPATEERQLIFQLATVIVPLEKQISKDEFYQGWMETYPERPISYLHCFSSGGMMIYAFIFFEDMQETAVPVE